MARTNRTSDFVALWQRDKMRQRAGDRVPALELEGSGAHSGACGPFAWNKDSYAIKALTDACGTVVAWVAAASILGSSDN